MTHDHDFHRVRSTPPLNLRMRLDAYDPDRCLDVDGRALEDDGEPAGPALTRSALMWIAAAFLAAAMIVAWAVR